MFRLDLPDLFIYSKQLFRFLTFGKQDQVDIVRDDVVEVLNPPFALVYADHPFGPIEINTTECVADQETGLVLFIWSNRIFEVEDNAIGFMDAGVDHQAGGVPGQVKPGEPVAVFCSGIKVLREHVWKPDLVGCYEFFNGSFKAGSQNKREGS